MKRRLAALLTALLMALTLLPTALADVPTYTYSVPTVYSDEITVEIFAVSYRAGKVDYVDYVCVPMDYTDVDAIAEDYGVEQSAIVSMGRFLRYDVSLSDLGAYRLSSGTYYIAYDDTVLQLYMDTELSYQTFNANDDDWVVNQSDGEFRGSIAKTYGVTHTLSSVYSLYFELPMDLADGTVIDFTFTKAELGLVDTGNALVPKADYTVAATDGSITIRVDKTALQLSYTLKKAVYDACDIGDPYDMDGGSAYLTTENAAIDQAALATALAVLEDTTITQTQVDAALAVLNAAWIAPSVVTTNKTALLSAYNQDKAIYESAYIGNPYARDNGSLYLSEADAAADQAALAAALTVLADPTASQAEIDAALSALNSAWIQPSVVSTDKTGLLAAYTADKTATDAAQRGDPYDMDNGSTYLSAADGQTDDLALAAALLVLNNEAASQAVIDAALVALNAAWIAPSTVVVDTTALDAAIADAASFMESPDYAALSAAAQAQWTNAYAQATAVQADETHTQHEVDDAAALFNALPRSATLYGDANCDGAVDSADAACILRYTVKLQELSEQGAINADVDGAAKVTTADAACILRHTVKIILVFPVEKQ